MITVAVHLVTIVTQDCLENTDYTSMDIAYDPGVVHVHETYLDAPNSHDGHVGFISWWGLVNSSTTIATTTFSNKLTNRFSNWTTTTNNGQRHGPESSTIPAPVGMIKTLEVTHSLLEINLGYHLWKQWHWGIYLHRPQCHSPNPFIKTNTRLGCPILVLRLLVVPK